MLRALRILVAMMLAAVMVMGCGPKPEPAENVEVSPDAPVPAAAPDAAAPAANDAARSGSAATPGETPATPPADGSN